MKLIKWEELPSNMRNSSVKKYYDMINRKKVQLFLKRFFDIILSILILVLLLPIMLIIAIAIKIDSEGPIFYRQERITQYGKIFRIFKFRTMVVNADKIGTLVTVENDNRITRVGKVIRKIRVDEFPQLINVLRGDMTFVGTRPEVKKYVENYTDEMKATLLMPAGITSRASIEYKDEDTIINKYINDGEKVDDIYLKRVLPEKMKWNLKYIEQFNLLEDIKISLNTIAGVIK